MKLYPEDSDNSKYSDPEYMPRPLDSEASAKARMLTMLEGGCSRAEAIASGLNGADDVATVEKVLDEIMAEQKKLLALDRTDKDYAAKVAAECVDLDPVKWVAARPALSAVEDVKVIEKLP